MILTTTDNIEGKKITKYLGVVSGTTFTYTFSSKNVSFKDMFSSEKSYKGYAKSLEEAKESAFQQLMENAKNLNANAIVGISVDIESVSGSMTSMISIVGTAVTTI